jgi:hypothetical protein
MNQFLNISNIWVSENFVWIIFLVAFLFFLIMSLILNYHWKNYLIEGTSKNIATKLYWNISFLLLFFMSITALIFNF